MSRDDNDDDEWHPRTPTGPVNQIDWLDARTRKLEMRDATMHGIDGQDGAFRRLQKEHDDMKNRIDVLDAFRGKVVLMVTVGGGALGLIAGLISVAVEKYFK